MIYNFLYVPEFVEAQESDFFQSVSTRRSNTTSYLSPCTHIWEVGEVAFELSFLCFSDLKEAAGILEGRCLFTRPHDAIYYSNGRKNPKSAMVQAVSLETHRGDFSQSRHYQTIIAAHSIISFT